MEIKKKHVEIAMAMIMLVVMCIVFLGREIVISSSNKNDGENDKIGNKPPNVNFTVVLDAGHGGKDPGKVGINGSIESEINLKIVKKLKTYLEEKGVRVVLTRQDENGLYDENDSNKKKSDMIKRCEIVNNISPDILVSVHQNSYSSEGVKGAQVFYFKNSNNGEKIAEIIQKHLVEEVDQNNGRQHKENNNYYILKNVNCPAVIVECGFLSNYTEAELLVSEQYQQKLAEAIGNGVLEYMEKGK